MIAAIRIGLLAAAVLLGWSGAAVACHHQGKEQASVVADDGVSQAPKTAAAASKEQLKTKPLAAPALQVDLGFHRDLRPTRQNFADRIVGNAIAECLRTCAVMGVDCAGCCCNDPVFDAAALTQGLERRHYLPPIRIVWGGPTFWTRMLPVAPARERGPPSPHNNRSALGGSHEELRLARFPRLTI